MRVHVGAPHNIPFRIREIIHTAVKLLAARMELEGACLNFLRLSHDHPAQYDVPLTIIILLSQQRALSISKDDFMIRRNKTALKRKYVEA